MGFPGVEVSGYSLGGSFKREVEWGRAGRRAQVRGHPADRRRRRGCRSTPKGPSCSRWGTPACVCAATIEERVPPFLRGAGKGVGHRGVLHASPRDEHPGRPGGADGKGAGAHARDPAAGGAVAAGGGRLRGARRAHGHDRLRRAAGRRRDAHRLHQRGVDRAVAGVPEAGRRGGRAPQPRARPRGGGQRGDRRRAGARGPRLLRGLRGGSGHERGDDGGRPADRGAGDGGAGAVHAGPARRDALGRGDRGEEDPEGAAALHGRGDGG